MSTHSSSSPAVAVYCGSSPGNQSAFQSAAKSLGFALAKQNRPLVYGGGSKGIMGIVSGSVLEAGGKVTGIVPYAMVAAGGERSQGLAGTSTGDVALDMKNQKVVLDEAGREKVETIVVNSMHERKVAMAKRVGAFIGLPGGFGTFEEVFEAVTWTQLGIHDKPVVLLNVLNFYEPFRQMVETAITAGFISPTYKHVLTFVDGPSRLDEHQTFDWGTAALKSIDEWNEKHLGQHKGIYDWEKKMDGTCDSVDAI